MPKKIEITINGKAYPCRQTMGAMLRFKRETGKEVTDIHGNDFSEMVAWLWCCVVSACNHDGVEFNLSLMDFADSLDPEQMSAWADAISVENAEGDDEKKSQ